MKLKKIELNNFRQFYGEQSLEFSTHNEKNITLIHAENGAGKTALLNAILWCFFDETTNNFNESRVLLNKVAKQEDKKSYWVKIDFEHEGQLYMVERSHTLNTDNFRVFKIEHGSYSEISHPSTFINSVIPKDMAKYFFFQGEGIGKTSSASGSSVVKPAIRKILGFTIAEEALKDLETIKKEYLKAFNNADKAGEASKLENLISTLEDEITVSQSKLNDVKESINFFEAELESVNKKLENSDSSTIKSLHNQRDGLERDLKREESRLKKAIDEKRELISEFATTVFGYKLSRLALDFIDEQQYKGTVPAPYNEQLVKDILEESQCICGSDITPGSEAFNRISEMLGKASDPDLETRIRKARSQLTSMKNGAGKATKRFKSNREAVSEAETYIKKYNKELQDISLRVQDAESLEKITGLEKERSRIQKSLNESNRTQGHLELKLSQSQKKLEQTRPDLTRLSGYSNEMNKYKALKDYTEQVEHVLNDTICNAEKDIPKVIMEKVNGYLTKFVRQDYKAKLNTATFEIKLVDQNEQTVPESDGQSLLLSLTFMSSLIELSRERKNASGRILTPGAVAPFVVDAPFGDLDKKYKGHVAEAIPNSVEQVVFLLSSSHWEGAVEDNIRNKVGREYNLVVEQTGDSGSKAKDQITILGKNYDNARYEQLIERTVIEEVGNYV